MIYVSDAHLNRLVERNAEDVSAVAAADGEGAVLVAGLRPRVSVLFTNKDDV